MTVTMTQTITVTVTVTETITMTVTVTVTMTETITMTMTVTLPPSRPPSNLNHPFLSLPPFLAPSAALSLACVLGGASCGCGAVMTGSDAPHPLT